MLQSRDRGLVMVFCRTKRTAQKVADELVDRGFAAAAVHGDLGQGAREQALRAFRSGKVDVLVATDVAARGIDVTGVSHVVNYQCPEDEKTYVHRIGRTGRAGSTGVAVTLVDWDDIPRWQLINKALDLGFDRPAGDVLHLAVGLHRPRRPETATGRLPRSQRTREGLGAETLEDLGETGKRNRPTSGGRDRRPRLAARAAATRAVPRGAGRASAPPTASRPAAAKSRPRRRTRGTGCGRGRGGSAALGDGSEGSAGRVRRGGGTKPRRRRRRGGSRPRRLRVRRLILRPPCPPTALRRPPLRVWVWTAATLALVVVAALLWRGSDAAATDSNRRTGRRPLGDAGRSRLRGVDRPRRAAARERGRERPRPRRLRSTGSARSTPVTGEEAWHYTRANARLCGLTATDGVAVAVFRTEDRCDEAVALMPAPACAPGPATSTSARTPPSTPPTRSCWPAVPPGW